MIVKKEIIKLSIARPIPRVLMAGSFVLGIFIGAGMDLLIPQSTVNREGLPRAGEEPSSTYANQKTRRRTRPAGEQRVEAVPI
jgi:hypothetical protein